MFAECLSALCGGAFSSATSLLSTLAATHAFPGVLETLFKYTNYLYEYIDILLKPFARILSFLSHTQLF